MNAKLKNAVIKQLGDVESLHDVASHGASGGFSGFIYYSETCKFFKQNRAEIVALCKEMADEFGQDVISFIAGFNCLTDDAETRDEIGRAIYGRMKTKDCVVANALAWFALEETANEYTNEIFEKENA